MEIFRTAIFVLLLILCYSVQTQYEETNGYHMIQCHLYDVVIRILRRRRQLTFVRLPCASCALYVLSRIRAPESGRFELICGLQGDAINMREIPGTSGRLGMSDKAAHAVLSCNWVGSCSHRKRTVPEFVWNRTETTSSAGSRFGCLVRTRVRLLYSHLPKRSAPRGETN